MPDKPDNSLSGLDCLNYPVPTSPIYSIYDFWNSTGVEGKVWSFEVPYDDMVYSICTFCAISGDPLLIFGRLDINGTMVYHVTNVYHVWYSPGNIKTPKLHGGDILDVSLANLYANPHSYYWQVDFWRDPIE